MKETATYSPISKPKTWKRRVPKYDKNQVKLFMPFIRKIQQEEMKELDKEIIEERKHDEEFYQKEKMQAEVHSIKVQLVEQNIDNLKKRKRELFLKLKNIQEAQMKKKQEEELKNEILQQKLEEEKRNPYYDRRPNVPPIMGSSYRQESQSPITPIMNRSPFQSSSNSSYYYQESQNYQPPTSQNYYQQPPQQMYSPTSQQSQQDYKRNYNGNSGGGGGYNSNTGGNYRNNYYSGKDYKRN